MTRDEAIAAAAQVYRQILADPERAAAIRAHRQQAAAERTQNVPSAVGGRQTGASTTTQ